MKIDKIFITELIYNYYKNTPKEKRHTYDLVIYVITNMEKQNVFKDEIIEIIEYFNNKTGKKFKYKSDSANCISIRARLNDKYTVDDWKKVIDNKCKDKFFINNPGFLNPITLGRPSHFENYLNENIGNKKEEVDYR